MVAALSSDNNFSFPVSSPFSPPEGVLLYAKQSGITSFTSLWTVKRALNTTKIGHTGTLDNFADGLLVVLVNRTRKLTAHITNFDKTYEAVLRLGQQTDTLDRDGKFTGEGILPAKETVLKVLPEFTGVITQLPPVYSSIQIDGVRASDLVRQGKIPQMQPRSVEIYSLELVNFDSGFAHLRVHCSKGTYIRSLARDIGIACGSCAYLDALRRTAVGPFSLKNAVGFQFLPEFGIEQSLRFPKKIQSPGDLPEPEASSIDAALQPFSSQLATDCGFSLLFLKPAFLKDFLSGKPISSGEFENSPEGDGIFAVYCRQKETEIERFCGLIEKKSRRISYTFVLQDEFPRANPLKGIHKKKPKSQVPPEKEKS